MDDLTKLQNQVQEIERRLDNQTVSLDTQLLGMFEVVSTAPSGSPKTAYDQIKIYTSGATYRLYWYDWVNNAWRYATGT